MPIDETQYTLQLLVKRLDAVISVLLETARPEGKELSMSDRVRILSAAELRPTEIARILGITPANVSVVLHNLRKKKGKRQKPKETQAEEKPAETSQVGQSTASST